MVWVAATGTHFGLESSFPFPLRIQWHSWSLWKDLVNGSKNFSPLWKFFYSQSLLFPIILTRYRIMELLHNRQPVCLSEGWWEAAFPSCPGIWKGVPWHFKQEHFHTGLHGNLDFFFKQVRFWCSTHDVLHSGRCPSLRHSMSAHDREVLWLHMRGDF